MLFLLLKYKSDTIKHSIYHSSLILASNKTRMGSKNSLLMVFRKFNGPIKSALKSLAELLNVRVRVIDIKIINIT